jgi:nitrous oxide reductase accessory protein NosL
MKRIVNPAILIVFIFFAGCKNADNKKEPSPGIIGKQTPQSAADSLMEEVMDGHNVAMSKYGKLSAVQKEAQRLLDSINKLPEKVQKAAEPFITKLTGTVEDLKSSKAAMDKWMDEFNMDSSVNNIEQRIKYLTEEKLKVSKVKNSILGSLKKADSLLKAGF